jgi:hypothetical protein
MIGFLGNPRFGCRFLFELVLNGLQLSFSVVIGRDGGGGCGGGGGGRSFDELREE